MTVTAADVKKAIEANAKCIGVDEWILEILKPALIHSNGVSVTIDQRVVKRWHKDNFMNAMRERGFKITYIVGNRPAEYPYFDIGL